MEPIWAGACIITQSLFITSRSRFTSHGSQKNWQEGVKVGEQGKDANICWLRIIFFRKSRPHDEFGPSQCDKQWGVVSENNQTRVKGPPAQGDLQKQKGAGHGRCEGEASVKEPWLQQAVLQ